MEIGKARQVSHLGPAKWEVLEFANLVHFELVVLNSDIPLVLT